MRLVFEVLEKIKSLVSSACEKQKVVSQSSKPTQLSFPCLQTPYNQWSSVCKMAASLCVACEMKTGKEIYSISFRTLHQFLLTFSLEIYDTVCLYKGEKISHTGSLSYLHCASRLCTRFQEVLIFYLFLHYWNRFKRLILWTLKEVKVLYFIWEKLEHPNISQ